MGTFEEPNATRQGADLSIGEQWLKLKCFWKIWLACEEG